MPTCKTACNRKSVAAGLVSFLLFLFSTGGRVLIDVLLISVVSAAAAVVSIR